MAFYRITIWVKDREKPFVGIRESVEHNVDSFFRYVETTIYTKMGGFTIVDYEVAQLPRGCTAVKAYLRKRAGGNGMRAV